jgi:hypothetical protein
VHEVFSVLRDASGRGPRPNRATFMPNVSFDGQSFSVKGRRIWLAAVEVHPTLAPVPEDAERSAIDAAWSAQLRGIRHAGANAVVATVPWSMHEARPGRIRFDGVFDIARFVGLCGEHGLWVVLKIGPVVGGTFDGGGLPAWLSDLPVRPREAEAGFLDRVGRWFKAVADRVVGLQATEQARPRQRPGRGPIDTGPLLAVQIEDDYRCGVADVAERYLVELVRYVREVGLQVPILTANGAYATIDAAIDTLLIERDGLGLMRQLAALAPDAPRLATIVGDEPKDVARQTALVLAGCGQPILRDALPFAHAGATSGLEAPTATTPAEATNARSGLLLDRRSAAVPDAGIVRRLMHCASSFGHVFAQADIGRQAIVADPESLVNDGPSPLVLPVTGSGGTFVFVLGGGVPLGKDARRAKAGAATTSLLLVDGRRLEAPLGAASLSWFPIDVDLAGAGRLDYATATPIALLDRRVLVLSAPAGAEVEVCVNGAPMALVAPHGVDATPATATIGDVVVVVIEERQADAFLADDDGAMIGALRRSDDGRIELARGVKQAHRITPEGLVEAVSKKTTLAPARRPAPIELAGWTSVAEGRAIDGTSDRFATLAGPATFASCGARQGRGWYRASFKRSAAGTVDVHFPELADRALVWVNGVFVASVERGGSLPVSTSFRGGMNTVVLLVEAVGRPSNGDNMARRTGLFGQPLECSRVKSAPAVRRGVQVDPFSMRGGPAFLFEKHREDVHDCTAFAWSVAAKPASRWIVDLVGESRAACPGATVVVDGVPVARWHPDGPEGAAIVVTMPEVGEAATTDPKSRPNAKNPPKAAAPAPTKKTQGGKRSIEFIVDEPLDDARAAAFTRDLRLYEVDQPLGGAATTWSFARWTHPPVWAAPQGVGPNGANGAKKSKTPTKPAAKSTKQPPTPTWSRTTFTLAERPSEPLELDCTHLGRGAVLVNGHMLGRYAIDEHAAKRNRDGEGAAPRTITIPPAFLKQGGNELVVFDEVGHTPTATHLAAGV